MGEADTERRRHRRFELTCPVVVTDSRGNELMRTRTLNVSDGGACLAPAAAVIDVGEPVGVSLRVPRSTDNTFMYEQVLADARVVRHQPAAASPTVALAFIEPMKLELDA